MSPRPTAIQFRRIFHPSDFSEASHVAFGHALKLAVAAKASLTILHTGNTRLSETWAEFPRVRQTLENWKLLPPGSGREDLSTLGLDVEKVVLPYPEPARSIINYLQRHPHDLIVLATHQHDGLERWIHGPVAEPVARHSAECTLFLPEGTNGFISLADGSTNLTNILIPVDVVPDPQVSIDAAVAVAEALGCDEVVCTLFHAGREDRFPPCLTPGVASLEWRKVARPGIVEQEILNAAETCHADLIIMSTLGHHGFLDALRGSTTERIVRNSKCPVLAVPVHAATVPAGSTIEALATGKLAVSFGL